MKDTDLCNTPEWLMRHFDKHFDPCPQDPQFDGLIVDWKNPSFVNPPYSEPLKWVKKALEQTKKGINVVMLLKVDPSTEWYKLLIEGGGAYGLF